ncbi:MAG: ferredoxin--NADP reductase [bacterium]|nr:ferredoxin--NADP reductase [bacterium]
MTRARTARLLEREDLSPSLAIFRIEPEDGVPPFRAGQWMNLGLELGPRNEIVWRPYSISSPPEERAHLEFYVRRVWKPVPGVLTTALWERRAGDAILWRPPKGHFTVDEPEPGAELDPRLLLLLAGGTGLAPFASIVRHLAHVECERAIVLCHAASYVEELGYREQFTRLQQRDWDFRYVPTISRPAHESNRGWSGRTGRLESLLAPGPTGAPSLLERELDTTFRPGATVAYVCGYSETIRNVMAELKPRGFREKRAGRAEYDVLVDSFGQ